MRFVAISLAVAGALAAQPLPLSTPAKEGFSQERIGRIHHALEQLTRGGGPPGAITMLVRNGKIVDWRAFGSRDLENKLPMEKDTICRIFSMTKPVTSVAVMMLVEQGKLSLADRVDKFIPEFKGLQVYKSETEGRVETTEPVRPMTVKHLLTHTSGFVYGFGDGKVPALVQRANVFAAGSLKEFIDKMAKLPLASSPGEKYQYSVSIDVLGYLVEVVSQKPFDRFVQERILDPLRMADTHFLLPETKRPRVARIYSLRDGKLVEEGHAGVDGKSPPFGGMSLFSTIGDYARFAQMLLNGGELEGARLLGRKTVELMMMNHLAGLAQPTIDLGRKTVELMMMNHLAGLAQPTIDANQADGFGLGGLVRLDPARAGRPGSVGLFGWDGAASTYFRVDPKERMAALLFLQWMPFDRPTLNRFETLFYQSLVN